jgi:ATP-dependent RNA helicase SUPV3L1/SUV3
VVEGHPVGHVAGFTFLPDPQAEGPEKRLVQRAARRSLREEMPRRVALLEAAGNAAFLLGKDHLISWDGAPVARLRPGSGFTRPAVDVLDSEFLDGAQRERIRLRLQAWIDTWIAGTLGPLFTASARAQQNSELRGPLHLLVEEGGVVVSLSGSFPQSLRGLLKAIGVRAGRFALYVPDLLKPRAIAARAQLWALRARIPVPDLPHPGMVSIHVSEAANAAFLQSMGWVVAGPVLLRLDIAERIAAELAYATRGAPAPVPLEIGQRLGVRADLVPAILRGLGLRILPAPQLAPFAYGPPSPPMLASPRKRPASPEVPKPILRPDHPFAALAALRR